MVKYDESGQIVERITMPLRARHVLMMGQKMAYFDAIFNDFIDVIERRADELQAATGSNWTLEGLNSILMDTSYARPSSY